MVATLNNDRTLRGADFDIEGPDIVKNGTPDQRAVLPARSLGGMEIQDPKSKIQNLGGRSAGYALGLSRHIVASIAIVTTAHATMVYITISHAVWSE